MSYFIYILGNKQRTVFYIGVTNNVQRRVFEHKNGLVQGFTKRYRLTILLYFEEYRNIKEAIARDKQLKNWRRDWKLNLIKKTNPRLEDLSLK